MALIQTETVEINSNQVEILYLDNNLTRNSMTWDMGEEFSEYIEKLKKRTPIPRCLIISGKNDVFSAGGDLNLLKSFQKKSFEQNKADMFKFYNFFLSIRTLPFPVVGAINGHAVGAALSLALACDIRVFALEGKYSFNFVKLGIHPGMGSSYLVKELFGQDRANYLLMLGEVFSGTDAYRMGICHDAVAQNEVMKRAMELAINLSESGPIAMRLLKKNSYDYAKLQEALTKEAEAQAENFISKDFAESIRAIEEKRKAAFKDE